MYINKVELSGVNTSKLPVLSRSEKEELLKKIREMDSEKDWTFKETDEKLLKHCNKIVDESKTLENECKKYGFYYFNTFDDREKVFDGIIEMLKEEQKDG